MLASEWAMIKKSIRAPLAAMFGQCRVELSWLQLDFVERDNRARAMTWDKASTKWIHVLTSSESHFPLALLSAIATGSRRDSPRGYLVALGGCKHPIVLSSRSRSRGSRRDGEQTKSLRSTV
jgi:hypothetical protein